MEGKVDDFPIEDNYMLVMSSNYDHKNEYKYQEKYYIYGNFIILRYEDIRVVSMSDEDIEYIKNNIEKILKYKKNL